MKEEGKYPYETPAITVVEVKSEGVICGSESGSETLQDYNWNVPVIE